MKRKFKGKAKILENEKLNKKDKELFELIEDFMEELIADDYKKGPNWKGYEVYEPIHFKPITIGYPLVVFVKGEDVRLSTPEESLAYLNYTQRKRKKRLKKRG